MSSMHRLTNSMVSLAKKGHSIMKIGQELLNRPVDKLIKPSQVHANDYSLSSISPESSFELLRKQYSKASPFARKASPSLNIPNPIDRRNFAKPLTFQKNANSSCGLSYDKSQTASGVTETFTPTSSSSLGAYKSDSQNKPAVTMSFQQFLAEKFGSSYEQLLKQPASCKETHNLLPIDLIAQHSLTPQHKTKQADVRGLDSFSSFGHKDHKDALLSPRTAGLSPVLTNAMVPQQLIASRATNLAPIELNRSFDSNSKARLTNKFSRFAKRSEDIKPSQEPVHLPKLSKSRIEDACKATKSQPSLTKKRDADKLGTSYIETVVWRNEPTTFNKGNFPSKLRSHKLIPPRDAGARKIAGT